MVSIPYFAGFYEGEGNIEQTSKHGFRINIFSTDFDVISKVHQSFGGLLVQIEPRSPRHKLGWKWRLGDKTSVRDLLQRILPYLGERRSYDVLNALDVIDKVSPRIF